MFEKLRGVVRIEKRKIDPMTGEILPNQEPEIIELTNNMMAMLPQMLTQGDSVNGTIIAVMLAEKKMDLQGIFHGFEPTHDWTGSTPVAATSPELIRNPSGDDYILYTTRFDPPAPSTSRTINRILLRSTASGSFPIASITTLSPCIQLDNEILDVFYKVFIGTPDLTGIGHVDGSYALGNYKFLRARLTSAPATTATAGFPAHLGWSSFYSKPNGYPIVGGFDSSGISLDDDQFIDDCVRTKDFSWGSGSDVGYLFGSMISGNEGVISSNMEFMPPGSSKVQSTFAHGTASIVPFQDDLEPALGDGTITPEADAWDESANFPQLFKVDITADGTNTSATYKFSVRDHLSFDGNTCTPLVTTPHRLIPTYPTVSYYKSASPDFFPHQIYGFSVDGGSDGLGGNPPGLFANHGFTFDDFPNGFTLSIPGGFRNYIGLEAHVIMAYIVKYFNNMAVSADINGVSIADYLNFRIIDIDAGYTTSPLVVTSVQQIAIDPTTNDIFVACADTGLHRIVFTEGTFSAVVTDVTPSIGAPPAGITSSRCFGVDIKDNGDIWAMFDGALGQSTDSGASWTLYDPSTAVKFNVVLGTHGYDLTIPGEWSTCRSLKVHPTAVEDKLVIVVTGLTTGKEWIGWNRAGSAATSDTTISLTHNSTDYMMMNGNVPDLSLTKYYRWIEDNVWLCRDAFTNTTSTYLFYGTTVSILDSTMNDVVNNLSVGGAWWLGMGIITEVDSTDTLRILGHNTTYPYEARYRNTTATADIVGPIDDSIAFAAVNWFAYLGKGKFFYRRGGNVNLQDLSGSALKDIETDALMWTDYGWNGSAWEVNHAGSKTASASQEELVNGVTISFQDVAPDNFKNTDFYTFSICRGLLKDNATTASLTASYPFIPLEQGTELGQTTVPAIAEGSIVDKKVGWAWKDRPTRVFSTSATMTKPGVAAFNLAKSSTGGIYANWYERIMCVADTRIPGGAGGDFQFKFRMTWKDPVDAQTQYMKIGILKDIDFEGRHNTTALVDFNATTAHWWVHLEPSGEKLQFYSNTGGLEFTTTADITSDDLIELRRGPTYSTGALSPAECGLYINDTLIHTSIYTFNDSAALGARKTPAGGVMFYDITISYTSTRLVVTMGDSTGGNETAGFSDKFMWMPVTRMQDSFEVTIDGTPAVLNFDMHVGSSLAPTEAGEVTLLWPSGQLWFHSDDIGKDITAKWLAYRDYNP